MCPVAPIRRILSICVAVVFSAEACAPMQMPSINLDHVEVVDYWKERESSLPFGNVYPERSEPMLKIFLNASGDYVQWAVEDYETISAQAYFCGDPTLPNGMSLQFVYWNGVLVEAGREAEAALHATKSSGIRTYYTYIPLGREKEMPSGFIGVPPYQPYSLAQDGKDVCLFVLSVGGLTSSRSDEVRIRAEQIVDAVGRWSGSSATE